MIRFSALLLALLGVALTQGCAVNPVTGEQDFVLMSEESEIALGRRHDKEVMKSYDRYEDEALQAYVSKIGRELAAKSHRKDLVFRFTVLDSTEVNAFALPGGYIYITRGLLAYLNSEAELAAVLGHEIGHVTARHSVRQQSTATVTNVLGAVLAAGTGVRGAGDLANVVGTAVVRGYGREHELEADRLGAEYLARTSYDPEAMIEVIEVLKNQELFEKQRAKKEGREPRAYHGVFSTHPRNDTRLKTVVSAANKFKHGQPKPDNRKQFLAHLDGMTFGDSEKAGITRGRHFYHADLDFSLSAPEGWQLKNYSDKLVMISPGGKAGMVLQVDDINRRISPRQFIESRLDLDLKQGRDIRPHGLRGHTGLVDGRHFKDGKTRRVGVVFLDERAWILSGYAKKGTQLSRWDKDFLSVINSFHRLTSKERAQAKSLELTIRKAGRRDTWAGLARQSRIPNFPETQLRLLNDQYPDGEPRAGQLIKTVK